MHRDPVIKIYTNTTRCFLIRSLAFLFMGLWPCPLSRRLDPERSRLSVNSPTEPQSLFEPAGKITSRLVSSRFFLCVPALFLSCLCLRLLCGLCLLTRISLFLTHFTRKDASKEANQLFYFPSGRHKVGKLTWFTNSLMSMWIKKNDLPPREQNNFGTKLDLKIRTSDTFFSNPILKIEL